MGLTLILEKVEIPLTSYHFGGEAFLWVLVIQEEGKH